MALTACGSDSRSPVDDDGRWEPPVTLVAGAPGANNSRPEVAVDRQGNAVTVWLHEEFLPAGFRTVPGPRSVWASRFAAGSGWATAGPIDRMEDATHSPMVAVNARGEGIAVWRRGDAPPYLIWTNRFYPGAGWRAAELAQTDLAEDASEPRIAADPQGNAVAVWTQYDGRRSTLWANDFVPDRGWSPRQQSLQGHDSRSAFPPNVAMDAGGNGVAVWDEFQGGVWANRFEHGRGWDGPVQLTSMGVTPHVAFGPAGDALVVWGAELTLWASRFTPQTGWANPERVAPDYQQGAFVSGLAIDPLGNALVVWYEQGDDHFFSVWAVRFEAGKGWDKPRLLENDGTQDHTKPRVAVEARGNGVAVWAGGQDIFASRFVAARGWESARVIGSGQDPKVGMDPAGSALFVWSGRDGDIWAARFAAGASK